MFRPLNDILIVLFKSKIIWAQNPECPMYQITPDTFLRYGNMQIIAAGLGSLPLERILVPTPKTLFFKCKN